MDESKSTQVTGSLPIRILQPYVVLENHSGGATRPRKKFDIFIHFDTLLLSCAKSHMLLASRRQPRLLHVSAVDRRQTWSMDKS